MFIKSDLEETGLIEQAQSFDNYKEAFEFCQEKRLNRVELVVRVSDDYEFAVELPALAPSAAVSPVVVSEAEDGIKTFNLDAA